MELDPWQYNCTRHTHVIHRLYTVQFEMYTAQLVLNRCGAMLLGFVLTEGQHHLIPAESVIWGRCKALTRP